MLTIKQARELQKLGFHLVRSIGKKAICLSMLGHQ